MLYTLTEDEYAALSPKSEVGRRDAALDVARRAILNVAGRKCIHDPDWKWAFRYCSGCPLDPLENAGRPIGMVGGHGAERAGETAARLPIESDPCLEVALEHARIFVTGLARLRRLDDRTMNDILEWTKAYPLDHRDAEGFERTCARIAALLYPDVIDPQPAAPAPLPDPFALRCPQCRWSGSPGDGMTHPRQGFAVCPQCWRLGYESMLERVPLAEMSPKGREY